MTHEHEKRIEELARGLENAEGPDARLASEVLIRAEEARENARLRTQHMRVLEAQEEQARALTLWLRLDSYSHGFDLGVIVAQAREDV